MGFYDVLDQVIDLLRSRKRVSYRAVMREFDVDEAFIEDVKVELIEVQQIAVDQDDKMLIWTGETEGTPESATQPDQTPPQPAAQEEAGGDTGSNGDRADTDTSGVSRMACHRRRTVCAVLACLAG